jgi:hypothetical protein
VISIQHEGPLLVASVFGELRLADYQRFELAAQDQLIRTGRVRALVDLRDMVTYTIDALLEDFKFTRAHSADDARIAVLSEREAVRWVALLSQLFLKLEVRVFDDEGAAKQWLAPADQTSKESVP